MKQNKLEIVNQTFKKIKMKPLKAIGSVTKWMFQASKIRVVWLSKYCEDPKFRSEIMCLENDKRLHSTYDQQCYITYWILE